MQFLLLLAALASVVLCDPYAAGIQEKPAVDPGSDGSLYQPDQIQDKLVDNVVNEESSQDAIQSSEEVKKRSVQQFPPVMLPEDPKSSPFRALQLAGRFAVAVPHYGPPPPPSQNARPRPGFPAGGVPQYRPPPPPEEDDVMLLRSFPSPAVVGAVAHDAFNVIKNLNKLGPDFTPPGNAQLPESAPWWSGGVPRPPAREDEAGPPATESEELEEEEAQLQPSASDQQNMGPPAISSLETDEVQFDEASQLTQDKEGMAEFLREKLIDNIFTENIIQDMLDNLPDDAVVQAPGDDEKKIRVRSRKARRRKNKRLKSQATTPSDLMIKSIDVGDVANDEEPMFAEDAAPEDQNVAMLVSAEDELDDGILSRKEKRRKILLNKKLKAQAGIPCSQIQQDVDLEDFTTDEGLVADNFSEESSSKEDTEVVSEANQNNLSQKERRRRKWLLSKKLKANGVAVNNQIQQDVELENVKTDGGLDVNDLYAESEDITNATLVSQDNAEDVLSRKERRRKLLLNKRLKAQSVTPNTQIEENIHFEEDEDMDQEGLEAGGLFEESTSENDALGSEDNTNAILTRKEKRRKFLLNKKLKAQVTTPNTEMQQDKDLEDDITDEGVVSAESVAKDNTEVTLVSEDNENGVLSRKEKRRKFFLNKRLKGQGVTPNTQVQQDTDLEGVVKDEVLDIISPESNTDDEVSLVSGDNEDSVLSRLEKGCKIILSKMQGDTAAKLQEDINLEDVDLEDINPDEGFVIEDLSAETASENDANKTFVSEEDDNGVLSRKEKKCKIILNKRRKAQAVSPDNVMQQDTYLDDFDEDLVEDLSADSDSEDMTLVPEENDVLSRKEKIRKILLNKKLKAQGITPNTQIFQDVIVEGLTSEDGLILDDLSAESASEDGEDVTDSQNDKNSILSRKEKRRKYILNKKLKSQVANPSAVLPEDMNVEDDTSKDDASSELFVLDDLSGEIDGNTEAPLISEDDDTKISGQRKAKMRRISIRKRQRSKSTTPDTQMVEDIVAEDIAASESLGMMENLEDMSAEDGTNSFPETFMQDDAEEAIVNSKRRKWVKRPKTFSQDQSKELVAEDELENILDQEVKAISSEDASGIDEQENDNAQDTLASSSIPRWRMWVKKRRATKQQDTVADNQGIVVDDVDGIQMTAPRGSGRRVIKSIEKPEIS